MINLKRSVELAGSIVSPRPIHLCSTIWKLLLFVFILIVACTGLRDAIDIATSSPSSFISVEGVLAHSTMWLYILYLLTSLVLSIQYHCGSSPSPPVVRIVYMVMMACVQFTVSNVFQLLVWRLSNLEHVSFVVAHAVWVLILFDFFVSTLQFSYIVGSIEVFVMTAIVTSIAVLFVPGYVAEWDALLITSMADVIRWCVLCVVWHVFIFTHFKNWLNYKWWTSQRISLNVNELDILNRESATDGNVSAELLASSINGVVGDKQQFVRIVMGSCTDQKKMTIATYQALHREQPDMFLLLGDNIYADLAPPTITKPITQCCKIKRVFEEEYNLLLNHKDFRPSKYDYSKQVWLATWDDHDYGANDAAKEYAEKLPAKKAFVEFMEAIQETNKQQEIEAQIDEIKQDEARGVYYSYDYEQKLDADTVKLRVIMMDTRFDREEDETDIVGEVQWQWLREKCDGPDDIDWYLICNGSPILNEGPIVKGGHMKKTVGQETRDKLFEVLHANNDKILNKSILLSGDLHYSVWHSWNEQVYELTASSLTHSKPWFCCKCWIKYLEIGDYKMAKNHDGNGATSKSEPCQKNSFGLMSINKQKFTFCVKDAFGYSYLNISHQKA